MSLREQRKSRCPLTSRLFGHAYAWQRTPRNPPGENSCFSSGARASTFSTWRHGRTLQMAWRRTKDARRGGVCGMCLDEWRLCNVFPSFFRSFFRSFFNHYSRFLPLLLVYRFLSISIIVFVVVFFENNKFIKKKFVIIYYLAGREEGECEMIDEDFFVFFLLLFLRTNLCCTYVF